MMCCKVKPGSRRAFFQWQCCALQFSIGGGSACAGSQSNASKGNRLAIRRALRLNHATNASQTLSGMATSQR